MLESIMQESIEIVCDENIIQPKIDIKSPLRCDITAEQTPPSKKKPIYYDTLYPKRVRRAIDFTLYQPEKQLALPEPTNTEKPDIDTTREFPTSIHEKQYKDIYKTLLFNELTDSALCNEEYNAPEFEVHLNEPYRQSIFPHQVMSSTLFSSSPSIPYSFANQKILRTKFKEYRKICRHPFKVLDAPGLPNDYYLNLLDWSKNDVVAVALTNKVYLWEFSSCKVTNLTETMDIDSTISCVRWSHENPNSLAFSTNNGILCIYDVTTQKCLKRAHISCGQRIGCIDWNGNLVTTGSRDGVVRLFDIRVDNNFVMCNVHGHNLEVCGLKWDPNYQVLASGGNDNRIFLWNLKQNIPVDSLLGHQGAVKALAWSPHEHGLLASGGGSADRCIKFWNTKSPNLIKTIDTQSQVCNLQWSSTEKEILSTHGFSSNAINLWSYPAMNKLVSLKGHTSRVVYMSCSPDGEKIVTGSADETLRFWNIFSKNNTVLNKKDFDFNSYGTLR